MAVGQPILKLKSVKADLDFAAAIEFVRRETGKSSLRLAGEIARTALGVRRARPAEYFLEGFWRGDSALGLISSHQSAALNRRLSPVDGSGLQGLLTDKLLTGVMLRAAGFPALEPRAVFGKAARLPGVAWLPSAGEIEAFLRRDGSLPAFGKPLHGSLSIGAASFLALEDGGRSVALGDGQVVPLSALAREIATSFPRGYLFEPLIRQHPSVESITGPAVGGLRIVTLRGPDGIEPLYTAQRLPGPGAMVDAMSAAGSYAAAQVDRDTGRILRVKSMGAVARTAMQTSAVTGVRFDSVRLPFMTEAHEAALEIHQMLERPGLLGFDMALTPEGPLVTEINNSPFHALYQHATDKGFLNAEIEPKIAAALALVSAERARR